MPTSRGDIGDIDGHASHANQAERLLSNVKVEAADVNVQNLDLEQVDLQLHARANVGGVQSEAFEVDADLGLLFDICAHRAESVRDRPRTSARRHAGGYRPRRLFDPAMRAYTECPRTPFSDP